MAQAEYVEQLRGAQPAGASIPLSLHARQRRAQRGIWQNAIDWALEHGRAINTACARFLFLGRQKIAEACACGADRRAIEKCPGLVLLVSNADQVISVANALSPVAPDSRPHSGQAIPIRLSRFRILNIVLWAKVAIQGERPHPKWSARYAQQVAST